MGDILRHSLKKQLQFQEKKRLTMLSLHNVATAILLMVVHTLVSTHPNIPKANLQDREGWQKAFEGGRCGGNSWLSGHDESTQSQCQEACSSEDDCEFYCHSSTPPDFHWECLRYKGCPSINTTLHGSDASSYSCYMKPGCPIGYKQSGTLSADNDIPGKALGQSKQSTIDDCKAKCEAHPKCNSFMYGRKDEKYEKNAEQTDKCELAEETAGTNSWGTNFRFCTKQVVCEDMAVLDTFCPSIKSWGLCNADKTILDIYYQDYCAKTCGAC